VKVGRADAWQVVSPTTEWKTMATTVAKDDFQVATDLYYVLVDKR